MAQVVFSLGKLGNTPLVEQHKCLTTAPPPPPVRPAPPAIRTEIAEEEDAFTDVMRWLMRRNLSEKENPSVYVWGLPPESAIGGKQLGVGFLTSLPCRAMTRTWKDDQWKGCRVHASCFQLGTRWVQGGVIYGHAAQPTTQETRSRTNELASLLHERLVLQSQGLRFIAGDFNQEDGQIECMRDWADRGWINVQTWALQKFGTEMMPTCHGKTIKDHILLALTLPCI